MFKQVSTLPSAAMIAALVVFTHGAAAQQHFIRHVDIVNGSPGGDGTGWGEHAYKFLQDAIAEAAELVSTPGNSVDIWVAHTPVGSQNQSLHYRPDQGANVTLGDQTASFHLIDNVRILGGFEGGEQFESQRDPENNITILSGDLADDDVIDDSTIPHDYANYCENSRVVVLAYDVDNSAELDGFVIQGGQTAGLIATDARPRVFNCVFMPSTCAAVHLRGDSSVLFVDCEFAGSDASAVLIDTEARGYFVDHRRGTVTERAGGE